MANVVIIGSGFIAPALAIGIARAGREVALADTEPVAPKAAIQYIQTMLPQLEVNDVPRGASAASAAARLLPAAGGAEAVTGTAMPEALDVRRAGSAELNVLAGPDCLPAISPPGILRSACAEAIGRPLPLHGCPSDQSSLPRSRCRSGFGNMVCARGGGLPREPLEGGGANADHQEAGD